MLSKVVQGIRVFTRIARQREDAATMVLAISLTHRDRFSFLSLMNLALNGRANIT